MVPLFVPVPWWSFASPLMLVHADNWDYQPATDWGQGDINVERAIKETIATPGRQIGIVSEAVIELSDHVSKILDFLDKYDAQNPQYQNEVVRDLKELKKEIGANSSKIARLRRLVQKVDALKAKENAKSPPADI